MRIVAAANLIEAALEMADADDAITDMTSAGWSRRYDAAHSRLKEAVAEYRRLVE